MDRSIEKAKYNLVIFDDSERSIRVVRQVVESTPRSDRFRIIETSSVQQLQALSRSDEEIDVLLCDIRLEAGAPTGIDVVRRLFPEGSRTQVIYITGYVEYCTAVYETQHVYFLLKPLKQLEMNRAIDKALDNLKRKDRASVLVKFGSASVLVPHDEIAYVESKRRKVEIHTDNRLYETYSSMDDMASKLSDDFVRCHKSFLVNLDYVVGIDSEGLKLRNGDVVPVSQRLRRDTKDRFFRYLGAR